MLCTAQPLTVAIDTVSMCGTRIPSVEVCVLHSDTDDFCPSYDTASIQGAWSSEEEGRLLLAIEELARNGKTDMSTRGFWGSVSKALGVTRTPKQCQSKWCVLGLNWFIMGVFIQYAGLTRSEAKLKTKTRQDAGKKKTAIFWFASACHAPDYCFG
jgi:hypothetical protein